MTMSSRFATKSYETRGTVFIRPKMRLPKARAPVWPRVKTWSPRREIWLRRFRSTTRKRATKKLPFKSKSGVKAQLETAWENFARANYARAKELADKAVGLAN